MDLDSMRKDKCVVIKTSTRQTVFLPVVRDKPKRAIDKQKRAINKQKKS
jgi:hypothetical protein